MAFVIPAIAAVGSAVGGATAAAGGLSTVLGVASLGATVAGGALSAMGAMQQGKAAKQAADYQAQIARNNALSAKQNADYTRSKGAADAEQNDRKTRAVVGAELAQQGASGLDVNSGSPLDIRSSTAALGRLDTLTIKNNSEMNARAYDQDAKNQTSNAALLQMQGKSEQQAGYLKTIGSLVGTASGVSDKWLTYKHNGVF